jgi:hypothetical protein
MSAADLIHAGYRYYGECTTVNLALGSKFQKLSRQVEIICTLEKVGKITSENAYNRIARLCKLLET